MIKRREMLLASGGMAGLVMGSRALPEPQAGEAAVAAGSGDGLDVRAFREDVGIGRETADTDALEMAWRHAVDGRGRPGAAGFASPTTRMQIRVPDVEILYGGDGLKSDVPNFRGVFALVGHGMGASRIRLTSPRYLVDIDKPVLNMLMQDLQIVGGKGAYRNLSTAAVGGSSGGGALFERVQFSDYSVCALASSSPDDPFWHVLFCKFTGQDGSKCAVIPPGDGHQLNGNWWNSGRYGFHLRAGENVLVMGNRFGGLRKAPQPRCDLWIEPVGRRSSGQGIVVTGNKHGNENDSVADMNVLFAASETGHGDSVVDYGAHPHSEVPPQSSSVLRGMTFRDNEHTAISGRRRGAFYSTIERIGASIFADYYDGSLPLLFEFAKGVPSLSDGNWLAQTNEIHLRVTKPAGLQGAALVPCNRPGFGMVYDQLGVASGAQGVMSDAGEDSGFPIIFLRDGMKGFGRGAKGVRLSDLEPDMVGGRQALTAIFGSVEARAGITLASGNGAAGELCWVEIDLKRGKTNGMATVHVEIGVDSKRIIRRWVIEVPGEWKTFRFPFVLNQVERDVSCFVGPAGRAFAAGAKGTVRVGRIRAYQHSRPVRDLADRGVSPDNGDAGKRLSPLRDAAVQVWDSHLTQDRVVELATDQVYTGAKFRIVRRARASGAAQLRIATSPVQVLRKASTWCDVEFSNGVWIATGSGVL